MRFTEGKAVPGRAGNPLTGTPPRPPKPATPPKVPPTTLKPKPLVKKSPAK